MEELADGLADAAKGPHVDGVQDGRLVVHRRRIEHVGEEVCDDEPEDVAEEERDKLFQSRGSPGLVVGFQLRGTS